MKQMTKHNRTLKTINLLLTVVFCVVEVCPVELYANENHSTGVGYGKSFLTEQSFLATHLDLKNIPPQEKPYVMTPELPPKKLIPPPSAAQQATRQFSRITLPVIVTAPPSQ